MKSILELSEVKARKYFMESSNYCNLELPIYIDFSKVLSYVEGKVGNKTLKEILKEGDKMPSEFEGVNHRILVKKDAKFTYRPIDVANPYLYYLLVRQMTTRSNWKDIKNHFATFACPNIDVISIPTVKGDRDKSHKAAGISDWWENLEQKTLALSLKYRYMFVTDITNCYGSIYTHFIARALLGGKDVAKSKKGKPGLLGNIIDTYMQGMQYGQTNGIPQGSVLFDFIAEIVLGYADSLLGKKLTEEGITKYKILRYRDDYRIFSNKKDELEGIAFHLQAILADFNFQLNAKKTLLTEDVIENALKPDKLAYMKGPLYRKTNKRIYSTASTLQQELLYIHQFAKEFPNCGTLIKLLTAFSERLSKRKKNVNDPEILIAILTEIVLSSPKCYPIVLQICSMLINNLPTTAEREDVVKDIYEKFQLIPNIGELQIWMQRITYKWAKPIAYPEPICKVVANEPEVVLWNNDWVADEYKDAFPQYKICTNWLRDCYTPVIDIDEVSLFDTY